MTIREFFSFRENKFFWVNIILMAVVFSGIVFGVLQALDSFTQHGHSIQVPDIKGLGVEEAAKFLRNKELKVEIVDSAYVKNKAVGAVLDQNPIGGQRVKSGRTIYLTINSEKIPQTVVPDVADNSSLRQAQAKLMAVGFKLATEEMVSGEKDWVYGVKYKGMQLSAGQQIPTGATLTLMVGNGSHETLSDSIDDEETDEAAEATQTPQDESWF